MSNTFGRHFRITTFGESHGPMIGVVIDGCPAGLQIDIEKVAHDLARRRPGQSHITTQRKESDTPEFVSGIVEGKTTGAPVTILIHNSDQRSSDYDKLKEALRPSHADYTWLEKFGVREHRGGGRSSARETASWVAAGSVAKQLIDNQSGVKVEAWVSSVGLVELEGWPNEIDLSGENAALVRCPDEATAKQMVELIEKMRSEGDTVGGTVSCRVKNVPTGLGEPIFGKLDAQLAHAMMTINAAKGVEIGSGFAGTQMQGSSHNDEFYSDEGQIKTRTNNSGGIQGGISNGEEILFRVGFKPVSTLMQKQQTVNTQGEEIEMEAKGRHDPCVVPRAVPVVEAMAALVLADAMLARRLNQL